MTTATAPPPVGVAPPPIEFAIWPKQAMALRSKADELFFGGAAGGGKSHYLRVDAIRWCMAVPGLQASIFRRLYIDLKLNHMEGPQSFNVMLAPLIALDMCAIVGGEIRFWNGSKIPAFTRAFTR